MELEFVVEAVNVVSECWHGEVIITSFRHSLYSQREVMVATSFRKFEVYE